MRKEGHCEAAVFLFCVLVQSGGSVAYEAREIALTPRGRTRG